MSPVEIGQQLAVAKAGSVLWLKLIDRYMLLEPQERQVATSEFFTLRSVGKSIHDCIQGEKQV